MAEHLEFVRAGQHLSDARHSHPDEEWDERPHGARMLLASPFVLGSKGCIRHLRLPFLVGRRCSSTLDPRLPAPPACELLFDAMSSRSVAYPNWIYYPTSSAPPAWVDSLVEVVTSARSEIESASHSGLSSDSVLLRVRPGLELLGYTVETSKKRADKVRRRDETRDPHGCA